MELVMSVGLRAGVVGLVVAVACTPKTDSVGEIESGTQSGSMGTMDGAPGTDDTSGGAPEVSSSGDGGTTSLPPGESTTGSEVTDCGVFTEADACELARVDDLPCSWQTFTAMERTGDTCVEMEPTEQCVQLTGDSGAAGCAQLPGCTEPGDATAPHYRILDDGTVLIAEYCGGAIPVGWAECETGFLDDDVPECACLCEAQGGGTSGG